MPARLRLRAATGALLSGVSLHAAATWRCVDPWAHVYVGDQDLAQAGMQCEWQEPAADAAEAPAPDVAPTIAAARRGALVLAPRGPVPAWLLPGAFAAAPVAPPRSPYDPLIATVATAYGQDAALLRAIVQVESRFDPNAVSARGAIGLMQVMPSTAAQFGLADPQKALFEPESNLRTGAQVLRSLLLQFAGDTALALAAYNVGPGSVLRSGYAVPDFPETQNYVRNVLALWRSSRQGL